MTGFCYRNGVLHGEAVDLRMIAGELGTPFYCYSSELIGERFAAFTDAFADMNPLVCFAAKANSNQAVLATFAGLGAGADIVSGGELARALTAGIPAHKILYSGVGKTAVEISAALEAGIGCFNVESEPELLALSSIAAARNVRAPVSFRINPDIDAHTHAKISTGKYEDKFGIPIGDARRLYAEAARLPGIDVVGVDAHIGSQITCLEPFDSLAVKLAELAGDLIRDGHALRHLDFGGGLGVSYLPGEPPAPTPEQYAAVVRRRIRHLSLKPVFEIGRFFVGPAGVLVTKVLYIKKGRNRTFVIVDAAMNDLIRPTLYDAYHHIQPVEKVATEMPAEVVDVVGPVCETGDFLALQRSLPPLRPGDLLAVMTAGAYGAVQAGTYNSRPLVPEVMIRGEAFAVIRPRPSYEDMILLDRLPPWLQPS
ncbi:MAG: diaminopimelate decarboxylase [Methylobacteriaceae bacterium]|jgi:diaminopimelate decarboxylase|nr:diaminopimelate decarboxylase [Methylobacteriaceae bacterium]